MTVCSLTAVRDCARKAPWEVRRCPVPIERLSAARNAQATHCLLYTSDAADE